MEAIQKARWRSPISHDDVIRWKHFPRYWSFVRGIHRSPVNSHHKGQWRGAVMFSLICVWTNGWANHRDTVDLRRSLWRHCCGWRLLHAQNELTQNANLHPRNKLVSLSWKIKERSWTMEIQSSMQFTPLSFAWSWYLCCLSWLNTLRPRQNGRHFADDIFKGIFVKENVWILNTVSLKYAP